MGSLKDVDIDAVWDLVVDTVFGLKAGGRLPDDADPYDPQIAVVIGLLRDGQTGAAESVASDIKYPGTNKVAAFAAYELITRACLAAGGYPTAARSAASRAAAILREIEAELATKRRRANRGWQPIPGRDD